MRFADAVTRSPRSRLYLVHRGGRNVELAEITDRGGPGAALVPIVLTISVTPTRAQPPRRVAVKEPAAIGCAEGPTVGQGREPRADLSSEELELLGFQVEMERDQLRLAESRLEQASRWEARARELAHSGRVPIELFIVAQAWSR